MLYILNPAILPENSFNQISVLIELKTWHMAREIELRATTISSSEQCELNCYRGLCNLIPNFFFKNKHGPDIDRIAPANLASQQTNT